MGLLFDPLSVLLDAPQASLSSLLTIAAADSRDGDVCEAPYEDQKWSAFVYFLFSTIIILVCLASFPMLLRHPVVQFWIQRNSYEATVVPAHAGDDKQSLIKAGSPFEDSEADPYTNAQARLLDPIDTHLEPDQEAGDGGLGELEKADTTYIFKRVLPLAFAVCSVFTVTLAVFPSGALPVELLASLSACTCPLLYVCINSQCSRIAFRVPFTRAQPLRISRSAGPFSNRWRADL